MTFSTFTPVQWIAFIFVALGLIKLLFIAINKTAWFSFATAFYSKPKMVSWITAILAAIVFYYLIQTISIVTIMAVMAFTSLLVGFAFMQYSKELMALAKKIYGRKFTGGLIIYILIWALLMIWALKELFS